MKKLYRLVPLSDVKRKNRYFLFLLFSAILAAAFLIDPYQVDFISCYFLNITGYPCPTCGISRSLFNAAHFRMLESFFYHPFGPLLFVSITLLTLKAGAELITEKELILSVKSSFKKWSVIVLLIVWFSYWFIGFI